MDKTLIFGLHAVTSLLQRSPEKIQSLYLQKGRHDQRMREVVQLAEKKHIFIESISKEALDKMMGHHRHQGIACRVHEKTKTLNEHDLAGFIDDLKEPAFFLILDGVQDPHNLGACLRSADAAGVHAVIAPKDKSASLTPVVRKVACGAAETVPFIQVTNLARTLRLLKDAGVWIVGTAGEADQLIYEADFNGPIAVVMGNEGEGIRRLTKEHCDFLVKIPMQGSVSSLNVSVATGVVLFEANRQRNKA